MASPVRIALWKALPAGPACRYNAIMAHTITNANKKAAAKTRKRRTPEASRKVLLDAAQTLLAAKGPAGVTLNAVARRAGMTHGNVTHHFGTSAALHAALVAQMAEHLSMAAGLAVEGLRKGQVTAETVVDMVFAAFEIGGYGRLIGWMSANGQTAELAPILDVLRESVRAFRTGEPASAAAEFSGAGPIVLSVITHALAAALIGGPLERATEMPEGSMRRLAASELRRLRVMP